jgi:hypothetical protein
MMLIKVIEFEFNWCLVSLSLFFQYLQSSSKKKIELNQGLGTFPKPGLIAWRIKPVTLFFVGEEQHSADTHPQLQRAILDRIIVPRLLLLVANC